jgi:hypothetical protein
VPGEDPLVAARYGTAFINGIQGNHSRAPGFIIIIIIIINIILI